MIGIIKKIVEIWEEYPVSVAILTILSTFALYLGVMCLQVWFIMLLWNWVMVALFGIPVLDFWAAFGLYWLCSLLFSSKVTFCANSED